MSRRRDVNKIAKSAEEATHIIDSVTMIHHERYEPNVGSAYERIQAEMGSRPDIISRYIQVPAYQPHQVLIAYIDGLTDIQTVDPDIIAPLLEAQSMPQDWDQIAVRPGHISPRQE